jgi:APA family basic amino acid/polyamine antiporter
MAARSDAGAIPVIDPPINVDSPAAERQLGLTMTTALVVGNMIGAGIFLLPAVLAPYGANATYGWLVTIAGALFIAATLAILSAHIEGGPFVYVEEAFGSEVAFVVMWSYLVSIWTTVAVLPIAAVSNLSHVAPVLGHPIVAPVVSIAFAWFLMLVNATGARTAGAVQVGTSVLKAMPLIAVVVVAAIYLGRGAHPAQAMAVPVSTGAIAGAASLALFSMLGTESAVISTDKVKNPRKTLPVASVLGGALTGLIYLGATWAVLYLLPGKQAASSPSPFADATQPFIGSIAGSAIAIFAAISALGCLNGWILCVGEVPLKLARDGALPAWFAKTSGRGTPVRAQMFGCVVGTLLIAMNYSRSLEAAFAFITLIAVVSTLVLYTGCTAGALWLLARGRLKGTALAVCATIGFLFSLWSYWGAGEQATLWGAALVATGIPILIVMKRSKSSAAKPTLSPEAIPAAPLE